MTQTVAELEATLEAQIAYGKWNVAGTANRLHEARLAAMTPTQRKIHAVKTFIGHSLLIGAGTAMTLAPFVAVFKSIF